MDEQRATRVMHVGARPEVHVLKRVGDIEEPAEVHLHAERAQHPAEHEDVVEQCRHDVDSPRRRLGDEANEHITAHGLDVVT